MANLKFIILQYSYVHFVSCLQHHNSSVHCFLEANVLSDLTQMDFFLNITSHKCSFSAVLRHIHPWNPPSTNTILSVAHCGDFWSLKCYVKGHHNGGSKGGGVGGQQVLLICFITLTCQPTLEIKTASFKLKAHILIFRSLLPTKRQQNFQK